MSQFDSEHESRQENNRQDNQRDEASRQSRRDDDNRREAEELARQKSKRLDDYLSKGDLLSFSAETGLRLMDSRSGLLQTMDTDPNNNDQEDKMISRPDQSNDFSTSNSGYNSKFDEANDLQVVLDNHIIRVITYTHRNELVYLLSGISTQLTYFNVYEISGRSDVDLLELDSTSVINKYPELYSDFDNFFKCCRLALQEKNKLDLIKQNEQEIPSFTEMDNSSMDVKLYQASLKKYTERKKELSDLYDDLRDMIFGLLALGTYPVEFMDSLNNVWRSIIISDCESPVLVNPMVTEIRNLQLHIHNDSWPDFPGLSSSLGRYSGLCNDQVKTKGGLDYYSKKLKIT